ncbi:MAG: rhomboid family GlyGly-CTERM serine protease [Rhodothermales bacterium]|jgi:rhomboid family GlyGly-CTERM serine protease
MHRIPWLTLSLAGVILVIQASPELVAAGEWQRGSDFHRVISCHFTHWSWDHLSWNLTMLLILGIPCELANRRQLGIAILASALAIPLAISLCLPQMDFYRGFSGVDSALLTLLLAIRWRQGQRIIPGLIGLAFAAKILFELQAGTALFADSAEAGFVPVPLAHAVGAVGGLLPALHRLCGFKRT